MDVKCRLRGWVGCASWTAVAMGLLLVASAFAANPVPQVAGPPVPQAVVPGSGAFTLTVYGANFVSGAVVNWNRNPRSTTFISARELQAQILALDVATATAGYITVTNPPPGGGISSSSYGLVEVHTPTKTIVTKKPHVYLRGNTSFFLNPTDFDNDGILDFAASWGAEIRVLLGKGDGKFRVSSTAPGQYYAPSATAYGDFNNDGNEDLVFGADWNGPPFQLQVDIGEGNGKFKRGSRFGRFDPAYPLVIAVADFSRDGNLDLVTIPGTKRGNFGVVLGNGDGTFKHLEDYFFPVGGEMVASDFNGDGILDLVFLSGNTIYISVGNGDGTFKKPQTVIQSSKQLGSCSFGPGLLTTDFNGDGNADIAYCERDVSNNKGKIWVALGNGGGTFKKPTSIVVHPYQGAFSFAAGDFNSDGKTDLMANYFVSNDPLRSETDLFPGNGDGSFQKKKIITLPGEPYYNAEDGIEPTDFNSDGLLDFIFQQPGDIAVFVRK